MTLNSQTFISSANLTKRVQYRFPKSKRRRIRKKWFKDSKNWKTVPDDAIYIMGDRAICHPTTLTKLKNETKQLDEPQSVRRFNW